VVQAAVADMVHLRQVELEQLAKEITAVQAEMSTHQIILAAVAAVQARLAVLVLRVPLRVALAARVRNGLTGRTTLAAVGVLVQEMLLGA
jgi:hypothetical protein